MTQHQEVQFIPTKWVDRALDWPGLMVCSYPVKVPVQGLTPQRRQTDPFVATTSVNTIERLLHATFNPSKEII